MNAARPTSLAPLTVLELAPPDMVTVAAGAGFTHVGMRLIPATPTEPAHATVGDTPTVREIRARLDATGVRVLDVEIFRLKPDTRVADYRAALETGAWLGAKHALCTGQDPDPARLADRLAEFARLAAGFGLTADLEFMSWTEVDTLSAALRAIAAAREPNLGIVADAYHVSRTRLELAELARAPRERLRYAQLCDAPAAIPPTPDAVLDEARSARLFPGEGELDLLGLLLALPPGVPVAVEVPTRELAKRMNAMDRAKRARAALGRVLEAAEQASARPPGRTPVRRSSSV